MSDIKVGDCVKVISKKLFNGHVGKVLEIFTRQYQPNVLVAVVQLQDGFRIARKVMEFQRLDDSACAEYFPASHDSERAAVEEAIAEENGQ